MPIRCHRCDQPIEGEPAVLYSPGRKDKFCLCEICYRIMATTLEMERKQLAVARER